MRKFQFNNITLIVTKDYHEMSQEGADIITSLLKEKPGASLGLATGSTPLGLYSELIKKYKAGQLSFKEVSTYNLDEYYPIDKSNRQSYAYFMRTNLFNHVDIQLQNTHIPNGMAKNSTLEGLAYEEKIRATKGLDLQVLGIGSNGHIGFNEPSDVFEPLTHRVQLNESTLLDNARFFESIDKVPTEAITMGIGTIMSAKKILLLASGTEKASIIKEMLTGKINPYIPASILQLHPAVTIIVDEPAAHELLAH